MNAGDVFFLYYGMLIAAFISGAFAILLLFIVDVISHSYIKIDKKHCFTNMIGENMNADEILKMHETCYAYNESFNYYYKVSMPRHECEEFVARRNECKGGRWCVRRKIEYENHFILMSDKICAGDGSIWNGGDVQGYL